MRTPAGRSRAARAAPGRGSTTTKVAPRAELGELAVEQRGALLVERAERLVEDEQLRVVQERRQSASRWCIPRENESTRWLRASQSPKRSSSMPIRSRRSGTR